MTDRGKTGGKTNRGRLRVRPDDLGRIFGKILAGAGVSLWLSLVLLVVVALASAEDQPTFMATNFPIFPVIGSFVIGSWIGIWASLLGYSLWSYSQLRQMPDKQPRPNHRNPLSRVYYLLALILEDPDEQCTYELRLQLTFVSFVSGIVVLVGIPIAILHG